MEKESSSLVARLNLLCARATIRKSPSPSKFSSLLCSYATHVTRTVNCCVLSAITTNTITNALFTVVYLLREISKPAKGSLLRFCRKQFLLGLFLQPTLMHNSITTYMSHYYLRHVSGLDMPILRRNNCTNTASGILALISGCTPHRLRAYESEDTRCCVCAVVPPEDGHVKTRNMSRIVVWHTCCYWIVH